MGKINMIRQEGGSRVLAVSSVLPKGWLVVELSIIKQAKNFVTIKINKVK